MCNLLAIFAAMIEVKDNLGETYVMRSLPSEITVGDFEKIISTLNDKATETLSRYAIVFHILGLPKAVIEEMELEELGSLIKTFTEHSAVAPSEMQHMVEINGDVYRAYDGETFRIKVKDMKAIEKCIGQGKTWIADMLSVLFKKDGLNDAEHYDKNHIAHKADLFRKELTADIAFPYMVEVSARMVQAVKKETNATTEPAAPVE